MGNKQRDKVINKTLKTIGWRVVRIWEHDIDNEQGLKKIIGTIKTQQSHAADVSKPRR